MDWAGGNTCKDSVSAQGSILPQKNNSGTEHTALNMLGFLQKMKRNWNICEKAAGRAEPRSSLKSWVFPSVQIKLV